MNDNLEDFYRSTEPGSFSISGGIGSTTATRSVMKSLTDGIFLVVANITTPVGTSGVATTEYRRTSHERPIVCRVTDELGAIIPGRVQPSSATLKLKKNHEASHTLSGAVCKGTSGFETQFTTANTMQVYFVVEMRASDVLVLYSDSRPDTSFVATVYRLAKSFFSVGVPEV